MTQNPYYATQTAAEETSSGGPSETISQDEYYEKLDARLEQWQAKIDQLKAKAREAKADASIEAKSALEDAEHRFAAYKAKADQVKRSGKQAWRDLAKGCEESWNLFQDAASKAKQHLTPPL